VLMLFLSGYWAGKRLVARRPPEQARRMPSTLTLEQLFIVFMGLSFAALAVRVISTGPRAFYSGAQIFAVENKYGQADVAGALVEIAQFVLSALTTAMLYVLLERRAVRMSYPESDRSPRRHPPLRLLALNWLIIFPLFSLARSMMLYGTMVFLAADNFVPRRGVRLVLPAILVIATLSFGVAVVKIRDTGMSGGPAIVAGTAIASELSAWRAYNEIREDMPELHYQYGYRIFVPLLLKIVPRGLVPNKPYNSGGYFGWREHPHAAAYGFMTAETCFGDLYLNFGITGVLVGAVFIGLFAGAVDAIRLFGRVDRMGLFLTVLGSFPTLLRDNLSESLFFIGSTLLLYTIVRSLRFEWGTVRVVIPASVLSSGGRFA